MRHESNTVCQIPSRDTDSGNPEEIIKQPQGRKPAVDGEGGKRFFETAVDVPIHILR